jgi:hypothetical protein
LGWSFAVFVIFYLELKDTLLDGSFNQKLFLAVYIGLIFAPVNYVPVANLLTPPTMLVQRTKVQSAIKQLVPLMDKNSRVYVIYQGTNGYEFHITRYLIAPRTTNIWSWSLGKLYSNGDVWTADLPPLDWFNLVQQGQYNYILVGRADENLWKRYGQFFVGKDNETTQLFKVEPDRFFRIKT